MEVIADNVEQDELPLIFDRENNQELLERIT